MQDHLQGLANNFCGRFGLTEARIPFTEAFTQADIVVYNYLFAPASVESNEAKNYAKEHIEKFNQLLKQSGYEAAKDLLWQVANKTPGFTAQITRSSEILLRAAIEISEHGKTTQKLGKGELEAANEVSRRIKKFHPAAIQLFRDMLDLISKNAGKMPLINNPALEETYIHEFIHYILNQNHIVGSGKFNEGLCTYMHLRFRGNSAMTSSIYHQMSANYLTWVPFFKEELGRIPDHQIGSTLRSNLKQLSIGFKQRYG